MNTKSKTLRLISLACIFAAIMVVYVFRLLQLQLLQGDDFLSQVESTYTSTTKLVASRGEITDRNGRVLAGNKIVNNVVLQKAYLTEEKTNQTILNLCALMEEKNETWIDNLPLILKKDGTVVFEEGHDSAIAALRKYVNLQTYATAQNCFDALLSRYDLDDETVYSKEEQRRIVGIRYEMERTGFSLSNNYIFAERVSSQTLTAIKEASYRLPGVDIEQNPVRVYLSGSLMPHVIGTIGPIYAEEAEELLKKGYSLNEKVGKSGIEAYAEDYLRGTVGLRSITRNKDGDIIADNITREPIAGNVVSLTMDSDLEAFVQENLAEQVELIKKRYTFAAESEGAAVVVMDVNTFEVLAQATYPSYSIDDYLTNYSSLLKQPYHPLYNRVTQASYRPGSIFKPIVAALALNDGMISASSTVDCTHIYNFYPDSPMQCLGNHGATNAAKALKYSCNIFFYDVGRRLGIEKLASGAEKYFGIGQKTGIQTGEVGGVMSSPKSKEQIQGIPWYPGDTLQAAIGQMDTLITPLQMAVYTSTIANGGTRKQASIIHEILPAGYEGKPIWENPQTVLSVFPNKNNALKTVKEGMIQAADSYGYFNCGVQVAAKTGSPQITNETSFGTFISFAPAENPEIAVVAVGEKMSHGYVLATLCNKIYQYYFNQRGKVETIPPRNVLAG